MSVFGKYSSYYDLLYRDKDYAGEADFVASLIERHRPGAQSILELGCGSGGHALQLAHKGYGLYGIDLSREMLDIAEARRRELPAELASQLEFSHGDVREFRNGRKYDCVISLFHVVSYQPTLADLKAAFTTAREHLNSGGAFIFDVWYGPAVLTDRPVVRVKTMADDKIEVTRIAEPRWHPNECLVDVHYTVFIRDRASDSIEKLQEVHRMRYLSIPEIELLADATGLTVTASGEWMTGNAPGADTWGVCFVLKN